MKKLIFLFLLLGGMKAFNYNNGKYIIEEVDKLNLDIDYEIIPERDLDNNLKNIHCLVTIPDGYNKDSILIKPDIFGGISEFKNIESGDKIGVILEIKNNSGNIYGYKENSFRLGTGEVYNSNNYNKTLAKGLMGEDIYDVFSPYRKYNTAIQELVGSEEFNNDVLSDYNLEMLLIEKGYQGVSELNKYYLDYYNWKYNLELDDISAMSGNILKEIFTGDEGTYKETNKEIIELVYNNYFTKNVIFNLEEISLKGSIGNYLENNLGNIYFSDKLSDVGRDGISINMSLCIEEEYFLDIYEMYNYKGDFSFVLIRQDSIS